MVVGVVGHGTVADPLCVNTNAVQGPNFTCTSIWQAGGYQPVRQPRFDVMYRLSLRFRNYERKIALAAPPEFVFSVVRGSVLNGMGP